MKNSRILVAAALWLGTVGVVAGQLRHPSLLRNHPAIKYESTPTTDAVAELNRKLQSGAMRLEADGPSGYLKAVLQALDVPVESQMLVFSKTSFQAPRINPKNPRAIDRTMGQAVVTNTVDYTNLTRKYQLERSIDGRIEQVHVSEDEAEVRQWLTVMKGLPLFPTSLLERNREYYVRVSASARPSHGSMLWPFGSGTSAQAKFTFIR